MKRLYVIVIVLSFTALIVGAFFWTSHCGAKSALERYTKLGLLARWLSLRFGESNCGTFAIAHAV